ncbi:MAG: hypothetical protein ACOYCA_02210 [Eggerthellaceae bacterium]
MSNKDGLDFKRVLILAGAVIAFTIGSGFATGQEIIQYYTSYGWMFIGTLILFLVAFLYYNLNFAKAGAEQKFEKANDVYKYYCGKYLGTFLDYYSTIFCYMSFFVMIGGAASTLNQGYGLNPLIGGAIMAVLTIITVAAGLDKLVDAIGMVGPLIVILVIFIAVYTLANDAGMIPQGMQDIANGVFTGATETNTIKQAGGNGLWPANFFTSAWSYAGFVLLWFASFMTALGAKNGAKNIKWGIIIGAVAVCVAIFLVALAQAANINTPSADGTSYVWNADIPNLILASKITPVFGAIYAIVVYAGIYTTAVPLLYNPVSRFAKEGTARFRILAIVLGVVGYFIAQFLPFRDLVNIIYGINGSFAGFVIIFIIVHNIRAKMKKKNGTLDAQPSDEIEGAKADDAAKASEADSSAEAAAPAVEAEASDSSTPEPNPAG